MTDSSYTFSSACVNSANNGVGVDSNELNNSQTSVQLEYPEQCCSTFTTNVSEIEFNNYGESANDVGLDYNYFSSPQ